MSNWVKGVDYPEWGNDDYITTIKDGYLFKNETPKDAYRRIAKTAAKHLEGLPIENLESRFFDILWKGWLIPSTPVMANLGTDVGLPISCFLSVTEDSISGIWEKAAEIAMMSKLGGGTSLDVSDIRPIGSPIKDGDGGFTDGVLPFLKVIDATVKAAKQPSRRGACAVYMNVNHKEIKDFIRIADQSSGDAYCKNLQTGINFDDAFMKRVVEGDEEAKSLFKDTIKMRIEKGFPYMLFGDTANKNKPFEWNTDLRIRMSNLC